MSVLMFIPEPKDEYERGFSVPAFTEAVYNDVVLPVAVQVDAELVCCLGIGVEFGISSLKQLEKELHIVAANLPLTDTVNGYVIPRIQNLIMRLNEAFRHNPDAIVYIG